MLNARRKMRHLTALGLSAPFATTVRRDHAGAITVLPFLQIITLEITSMRLTSSLSALIAAFALGQAQAVTVTVDNFSNPFNVTFTPGTGLTATSGSLVTGSGNLATTRTMTNRIDTASVANNIGTLSSIAVGPSPNFFANALNIANAAGIQSVNTVTWTLDAPAVAASLAAPASTASLLLNVNNSDTGFLAADTRLEFQLIDAANVATLFQTVFLPSSGAANYSFVLSDIQRSALGAGSRLRMTISGAPGYDLSLDTLSLDVSPVPEPASLAMFGLGTVALLALRRRKAKGAIANPQIFGDA